MGIVSPWESHCQSPDSSLPAQTCEFNFSHTRRHRAASVIKRKQEETICCEERPQQIVTRFSGLWSHFQVSNVHVHIWILSYLTCGSDLRVEELRRNTNVHAGVNRESLFVIFIGVIYCFPSDKCLLLSGYKTFRVDVEGAPFCFSAKSVCQTTFHLFILFLSKKQQKHKMNHFWFDTWCLDQTFFLIKFNYFFKCNNYFEIRHLATFWIHIGKHNLDKHCVLRRCSFFLCCRLSTDFGRIIAESIWEAEDSHLWSDKQIQIFIIL